MQVFHTTKNDATARNAMIEGLHKAVAELRARRGAEENFEGFERELHAVFMNAECEIRAEKLERLDVNQPQLLIEGQRHYRVLCSSETYMSAAGPLRVWRRLYRRGRDAAVVPMELRAGIVAGQPRARRAKGCGRWRIGHRRKPKMCFGKSAT